MSARSAPALVVLALLGMPACFDPIVGGECRVGFSPCHGTCVPTGICRTLDASSEATTAIDGPEIDAVAVDADDLDAGSGGAPDDGGIADDGGASSTDASTVDGDHDGDAAPRSDDGGSVRDVADVPLRDDLPTSKDVASVPTLADARLDGDSDVQGSDGVLAGLDGEPGADVDPANSGAGDGPGATDDASHNAGDDASDAPSSNDDGAAIDDVADDDGGPDGPVICAEPLTTCNDQCVDRNVDPENCGVCDKICASGVCLSGECLVCGPEESVCGQQCLNLSTDPDNCGGCGIPCISGLCSNGRCEAAGTGRAIVIGHDYTKNRPAMNRILGNAVFLWPVNPVRLLAYHGDADLVAINGANSAIQQVATATGRQPSISVASSSAEVPAALATTDVFLVYAQTQATDTTLAQLGQGWKSALTTFVQTGGTVIVLDANPDNAKNAGTVQILSQAGLFDIARGSSSTGHVCTVIARGDALATGLLRTYLCEINSTNFAIDDTATTITPVVADGVATVVVHKVF